MSLKNIFTIIICTYTLTACQNPDDNNTGGYAKLELPPESADVSYGVTYSLATLENLAESYTSSTFNFSEIDNDVATLRAIIIEKNCQVDVEKPTDTTLIPQTTSVVIGGDKCPFKYSHKFSVSGSDLNYTGTTSSSFSTNNARIHSLLNFTDYSYSGSFNTSTTENAGFFILQVKLNISMMGNTLDHGAFSVNFNSLGQVNYPKMTNPTGKYSETKSDNVSIAFPMGQATGAVETTSDGQTVTKKYFINNKEVDVTEAQKYFELSLIESESVSPRF